MNADRWFYIDTAGTQFGPASAQEIRDALRMGRTTPASLAWREGLATWQPIASLAAELGIAADTPPPPPPPPAGGFARPPGADANPYQAPQATEAERVDRNDIAYAGFIRRFAALFVDAIIVSVVAGVLSIPFAGSTGGLLPSMNPGEVMQNAMAMQGPRWGVHMVVALLYFSLQESSAAQATLGKRAFGIKVTDLEGRRLSFGHALGRWVAASLSYITLYVGFAMAGFTARKQALHDMVAGTLVVDQWAFTAQPERQLRGPQGCAVALLVVSLLLGAGAIAAMVIGIGMLAGNGMHW